MLKLTGERLLLIPCSIHIAKAMAFNRPYLSTFLRVDVPSGWPTDEVKALLPYYIEELENDPSVLGWGVWILIEKQLKVVVGDAGFKGKPDPSGTVEIGYGIHPDFRNKGYASEAAQALTDWALTGKKGVDAVFAECDETNGPSIKVLKKIGMQCVGQDGSVLKWQRGQG